MKSIQIYKTKKLYKLISMVKTESGVFNSSTPIFLIPIEDTDLLKEEMFSALKGSKNVEVNSNKELLKLIKESSFSKLYQNSSSCFLYLEGDQLTIEPQRCYNDNPKEGLEIIAEEIIRMTYSKEKESEIINLIINKLEELENG